MTGGAARGAGATGGRALAALHPRPAALLDGALGVVFDIEGTLAPIAFVTDVLFPFARARLEPAIARAALDPRVALALDRLAAERAEDDAAARAAGREAPPADLAAYAARLIDLDRKSTGLKALQGVIWEEGFRSGALRAEVFADVPAALAALRGRGLRLRIYSSGSVLAQRLFFAHTTAGDLLDRFEGFHDTETGPKREASSYEAIARAMELAPPALLFLSDVVAELDAARSAGLRTALLARPGNPPQPPHAHPVLADLTGLAGGRASPE